MPFTLPNFNLLADVWVLPNCPAINPVPDVADVPCQMYANPKALFDVGAGSDVFIIRLPLSATRVFTGYLFEIPKGLGNFYVTEVCGNMHIGFPNEYKFATAYPTLNDGTAWGGVALP